MNNVVLTGRLVKDVELKYIGGEGTAVANVTIAVDKFVNGTKEADFIPLVVWGKQAESLAEYMGKGDNIGVSGSIQTRNFEAKDGTTKYVTEVVVNRVEFLSNKPKEEKPNKPNNRYRK